MSAEKQTHGFQAEVSRLLHLMIHSLYSNREIFLRELISNASDACDKLRFQALDNPALLEQGDEPRITLQVDKDAGTLTITDNGIGMGQDEVVDNLGTIARSGTEKFLANLSGLFSLYRGRYGHCGNPQGRGSGGRWGALGKRW